MAHGYNAAILQSAEAHALYMQMYNDVTFLTLRI